MLYMSAHGLQSQQAARHDRQNAHAELAKYEKDLKTAILPHPLFVMLDY